MHRQLAQNMARSIDGISEHDTLIVLTQLVNVVFSKCTYGRGRNLRFELASSILLSANVIVALSMTPSKDRAKAISDAIIEVGDSMSDKDFEAMIYRIKSDMDYHIEGIRRRRCERQKINNS